MRWCDLDRYEDRLDSRTDLVEAYDLLMAFVAKHLPNFFYLEGAQRISLREWIFWEVAANLLVHRQIRQRHVGSLHHLRRPGRGGEYQ